MWEFFDHVFSQGGFVALIGVVSVLAFGGTVRILWNTNQSLHRELSLKQGEHEKTLRTQSELHATHLNTLHEQRHTEAAATQERVLNHLQKVDTTLQKVGAAMDVVVEVVAAGRRRPPGG